MKRLVALCVLFTFVVVIAQAAEELTPAEAKAESAPPASPAVKSNMADPLTELEKTLQGTFYGPACGGDYTFKADGNFELKNFTPAGITLAGIWSIRWDALPPTLVIVCKTSDDPHYEYLDKPFEVKLVELNADGIALRMPDTKAIWRYSRDAEVGGSVEQPQ